MVWGLGLGVWGLGIPKHDALHVALLLEGSTGVLRALQPKVAL